MPRRAAVPGLLSTTRGAVVWNNALGELWRRTDDLPAPRTLARHAGVTQKRLREQRPRPPTSRSPSTSAAASCTCTCSSRLDRAMPDYRARRDPTRPTRASPPSCSSRPCAPRSPRSTPRARTSSAAAASGGADELDVAPARPWPSAREVAGYLAKYATKSTEQAGGLLHRDRPRPDRHARPCASTSAATCAPRSRSTTPAEPQADAARRRARRAAPRGARGAPTASDPDALAWRAAQAMSRASVSASDCDDRQRARRIASCAGRRAARGTGRTRAGHRRADRDLADVEVDRAPLNRRCATARPAPRGVRARARLPRPLPDQEPPLLHHLHRAAPSARTRRPRADCSRARTDADQRALAADAAERFTDLRYVGQGHVTAADALLAASAAARAREQRRAAREARAMEVETGGTG